MRFLKWIGQGFREFFDLRENRLFWIIFLVVLGAELFMDLLRAVTGL